MRRSVGQLPTERRIRLGLGYVPQEHAVFGRLSVRDNLAVGALTNRDSQAVNRVLEIFPKLGQRMDQVAGTLSGGERKMLAIGRALLSNPRVLLLDEPTEGVWIGVIEEITERLILLAREIAVVIVEQHLDLALRVADRAFVLDRGRVASRDRRRKSATIRGWCSIWHLKSVSSEVDTGSREENASKVNLPALRTPEPGLRAARRSWPAVPPANAPL